ncbi:MAG: protein kinase domain-containing protein [Deltaproteobacteria bacterium]
MTRRLGKYELLGKIAEGGMAEVFLARQSGPMGFSKLVVIKKILPQLAVDEKFVRMFLDEARLAAVVNHPNVVSIYELAADEDDESVYMAMEYIDGVTLKRLGETLLARKEQLPVPLALRVLSDACAGLDFAHNLKSSSGEPLRLVHRDVSPENLLITFSGQVKVVDFGIAKAAMSQERTRSGEFKGKFSYTSPEHARGQPLDRRADVWALGIILYWILAGRRPFRAEKPLELLRKIIQDDPRPLREYVPDVPEPLEGVVRRALAKKPDDRFQSARALQDSIEGWIRSSGQDASSARLSDYMNELFPEESDEQRVRLRQIVSGEAQSPFDVGRRMRTPTGQRGPTPLPAADGEITHSDATSQGEPTAPTIPGPVAPPSAVPARRGTDFHIEVATAEFRRPVPLAAEAGEDTSKATGQDASPKVAASPPAPDAARLPTEALFDDSDDFASAQTKLNHSVAPPFRPSGLSEASEASTLSGVDEAPAKRRRTGLWLGLATGAVVSGVAATLWGRGQRPTVAPAPAPSAASVAPAPPSRPLAPLAPPPPARPAPPASESANDLPAPSPPAAEPLAHHAAPPPRHRSTPHRPATTGPGQLAVRVAPWADVYVDGQKIGTTPFAPIALPAGHHVVRLVNDVLHASREEQVELRPGETHTVKARLEASPGARP